MPAYADASCTDADGSTHWKTTAMARPGERPTANAPHSMGVISMKTPSDLRH